MFQNAFKRRKDKQSDPLGNGSEDATTPPKLEGPVNTQPPSQPQPPVAVSETPDDTSHPDISLVQDTRALDTPPRQDEEALRSSLDRQPKTTSFTSELQMSAAGTEGSSDSTVVNPTTQRVEDGSEEISSTDPGDLQVFDTSNGGVRKSDLFALAAEMESIKMEKIELEGKADGLMRHVAQAETRQKEAKEEVDRSLKKIELLEGMLDDERKKNAAKAEEEDMGSHASLQHQLQEEKDRSKALHRELNDTNLVHELVKTEWRKKLEFAMEKLAVSEKKVRELQVETRMYSEQLETLERALRAEWAKGREGDQAAKPNALPEKDKPVPLWSKVIGVSLVAFVFFIGLDTVLRKSGFAQSISRYAK